MSAGHLFDPTEFGGANLAEPVGRAPAGVAPARTIGQVEFVAGPFGVLSTTWHLSTGGVVHAWAKQLDAGRTVFACGRVGPTLTADAGQLAPACRRCVARADTANGRA